MRFYHVSNNPHIAESVIYPRIPSRRLVTEDDKKARICVSSSIIGCLSALYPLEKGQHMYIYVCDAEKFIQPTLEQVADVAYTGEIWLNEATKIEYYEEIRICEKHIMVVEEFEIPFYEYIVIDR